MSTAVFPFEVWPEGIMQARIPANDNSLRSEVLSKAALTIADSEPGSPTEGDVHIVGTAWGAFATGDVVIYKSGTWLGFEPFSGWLKYNEDDDKVYRYAGGWSEFAGGGGGGSGPAPVTTESGTSHNITAAEAGSYIRFTSTSAKTCTFRPDSTEALPSNGEWHIRNAGTNNLTLTPGSGVTLNAPYGGTLVVPIGGTVTVKRVATDTFDVMGVTA